MRIWLGMHAQVVLPRRRALSTRFSQRQKGQRNNVRDDAESAISRKNVETRASGRPPEEAASDDTEGQARAILEDSEDRKKWGAAQPEDEGDV
jgi:hypothetical protein